MPDDDDDRRQRENMIAAVFVIGLVVFSIWLLHKYQQYRAASDCELTGRHNCAAADDQGFHGGGFSVAASPLKTTL